MNLLKNWIVLLVICAVPGVSSGQRGVKIPVEHQFAIGDIGAKLNIPIRIEEKGWYTFGLTFPIFGADPGMRDVLMKKMGQSEDPNYRGIYDLGVPIEIHLTVRRIGSSTEEVVVNILTSRIFLYSSTKDFFRKKIADIDLPAGDYIVEVENMKAAPEFLGFPTIFHVHNSYKGK